MDLKISLPSKGQSQKSSCVMSKDFVVVKRPMQEVIRRIQVFRHRVWKAWTFNQRKGQRKIYLLEALGANWTIPEVKNVVIVK